MRLGAKLHLGAPVTGPTCLRSWPQRCGAWMRSSPSPTGSGGNAMTTTTSATKTLSVPEPVFTDQERRRHRGAWARARAPDPDGPAEGRQGSDRAATPRTARAVDLAIGERLSGPIFIGSDGRRFDRHTAGRIVRRVARRAGVDKAIGPHTLRHAFITAALMLVYRSATSKRPRATLTPARPCVMTALGSPSTSTLRIS
jgi:hypothetical protein